MKNRTCDGWAALGRGLAAAGAVASVLMLGACASLPPAGDKAAEAEYAEINDPLEPANRTIFAVNRALDDAVLKPVARAYRDGVPRWVRARIDDALDNLRAPIVFLNDVLQGEGTRALTTLTRFVVNSTAGLGGLNDIAADLGLEKHREDFGQTLAVWGFGEGPYLMLPLFGPSNPRDAIGRAVDFLVDPFNRWAVNSNREEAAISRAAVAGVHLRAEILDVTDDLEKTSLDFYAAVRSLYRQRRADDIGNGKSGARLSSGAETYPEWPRGDGSNEVSGKP